MTPLVAPLALIVLYGAAWWIRRSDTWIGQRIRNSDHWAWEMAIEQAAQEVRDARARKYVAPWMRNMEVDEAKRKLLVLRAAEPRLTVDKS